MDLNDGLSEYELMRARNIKELEALMSDICTSDIGGAAEAINSFKQDPIRAERKKRKRHDEDEAFRFSGALPLEMRKSARLSNIAPQYTYLDLSDEDISGNGYNDVDDLERVVFRKKRSSVKRLSTAPCPFAPVEDITSDYLANIAKRNIGKVYSQNGTSCHQCRQKTTDSKTYCRSGRCVGVRGQFCGVCLKNRYGEEARDALMDSQWECPPCRGLCNCSICRTREGKRPTGILAPIAFRNGHKSVKDFLISLNGRGDYTEESDCAEVRRPSNCDECVHIELLGFDKDLYSISVIIYEGELCEREYDLIGFNRELKPVVLAY